MGAGSVGAPPVPPAASQRRPLRPSWAPLAGLLAALLTGLVLLAPSAIGLADNGDYLRLLCRLRLRPVIGAEGPNFIFVHFHNAPVPRGTGCVGYPSDQLPVLWVARAVTGLLGGRGLDLRVLGGLQAVLLGVTVWLVVRALPGGRTVRVLCTVLLLLVVCDIGMTSYLASAYSEPTTLLGLLLLLAAVLHAGRRPQRRPLGLLAVLAASALVVGSKSQNAVLAAPVAVAVLAWGAPVGRLRGRLGRRLLPAAGGLVLLVGAAVFVRAVPNEFREANLYNDVFFEIFNHSPQPAADARALGLDPQLVRYTNTNSFAEHNARTDPAFAGFYDRVGYGALARFYAARPARALALAGRGTRAAFELRPGYLGNYPVSAGRPPGAQACRLCVFSELGRAARPAAAVLTPLLWLGALSAGLALRRRAGSSRALADVLTLLPVLAALELAVTLLGEGDYEVVKHLFAVSLLDGLLLALAPLALDALWRRPA